MNLNEMKIGTYYRVTKTARNGIEVGDMVSRGEDGSITNHTAGGWQNAGDWERLKTQVEVDTETHLRKAERAEAEAARHRRIIAEATA